MPEASLKERGAKPVPKPAPRPFRPSPHVLVGRRFPFWPRSKRIHLEHWIAAAIVALAFANAARLLAS
jgi:hypothetical protein